MRVLDNRSRNWGLPNHCFFSLRYADRSIGGICPDVYTPALSRERKKKPFLLFFNSFIKSFIPCRNILVTHLYNIFL